MWPGPRVSPAVVAKVDSKHLGVVVPKWGGRARGQTERCVPHGAVRFCLRHTIILFILFILLLLNSSVACTSRHTALRLCLLRSEYMVRKEAFS